MGTGQGWLKAGIEGFPKSGKTYTGALLAVATHQMFSVDTPIAMYDTETGGEYIARMIRLLTGKDGLVARSRSFADLMTFAEEAEKAGIKVVLVDSITHPWRELQKAYLSKVNGGLKSRNKPPRMNLEFQDWGPIKEKWAEWTDWYLNSQMHIIICGRAGFEYDMQVNQDTGRKELVKTGVKMKTENEFGFEPSLLVEMERNQRVNGKVTMVRHATVIGDRFGILDGRTAEFKSGTEAKKKLGRMTDRELLAKYQPELAAVYEFFGPHLEALKPGAYAPVDTAVKTDVGVDENGDAEMYRARREKTIVLEEIQTAMLRGWPSLTKEDKLAKAGILLETWHTGSWTKVASLSTEILRTGLQAVRAKVAQKLGEPEPVEASETESPEKTPEEILTTAADDMPW
jgi:hypothetical protein